MTKKQIRAMRQEFIHNYVKDNLHMSPGRAKFVGRKLWDMNKKEWLLTGK